MEGKIVYRCCVHVMLASSRFSYLPLPRCVCESNTFFSLTTRKTSNVSVINKKNVFRNGIVYHICIYSVDHGIGFCLVIPFYMQITSAHIIYR